MKIDKILFYVLMFHILITTMMVVGGQTVFLSDGFSIDVLLDISVVLYFWICFSAYKIGYELVHPYFLFLYAFLGFILWNNFTTYLGITDYWDDLWIGDNFFKDISLLKQTYVLVIYSICFLHLGAITIALRGGTVLCNLNIDYDSFKIRTFRIISRQFYWISLPFYFCYIAFFVYIVFTQGYFALYGDYQANVPMALSLSDDCARTFFWIYVLTKPSFHDAKWVLISYSILAVFSLGMGTRGLAFCELLALLALWNYWGHSVPLKKLFYFAAIILISSPLIQNYRSGTKEEDKLIKAVVSQQGLPLVSLGASITYEDKLPKVRQEYIGGPLVEFGSSMTNKLGITNIVADNPETIYRLPQIISYLFDSSSFLSGWGIGNTYIAEFYIFGGKLGVCLISYFYMFFMLSLFSKQNSFFKLFCSFISLRFFLFTVRENPFYILVNLVFPVLIYLLLYLFYSWRLHIERNLNELNNEKE